MIHQAQLLRHLVLRWTPHPLGTYFNQAPQPSSFSSTNSAPPSARIVNQNELLTYWPAAKRYRMKVMETTYLMRVDSLLASVVTAR